jgi:hypothetical protein
VSRVQSNYAAPSTEPPHAAIRSPRPSTLSIDDQQPTSRLMPVVSMVTATLPTACTADRPLGFQVMPPSTVAATTAHGRPLASSPMAAAHGYIPPRHAHMPRSSNMPPQRGIAAASLGSGRTVVAASQRSPGSSERFHKSNVSNSGNRYVDNSNNLSCLNGR